MLILLVGRTLIDLLQITPPVVGGLTNFDSSIDVAPAKAADQKIDQKTGFRRPPE
jgi:hypothetical protein